MNLSELTSAGVNEETVSRLIAKFKAKFKGKGAASGKAVVDMDPRCPIHCLI